MSSFNWRDAIRYGTLIEIAEAVPPSSDYGQAQIDAARESGYNFLHTLYGDDLSTDVDPHAGEVVSFGFVAVSAGKELVAVLRGTDTIMEWLHDLAFLMTPCPISGAHGYTEDGFTAVYKSLRIGRGEGTLSATDSIKSYLDTGAATNVTVCGHSLGGALATLLTLDIGLNTSCRAPTSFTCASPRVGEDMFAGSYNAVVADSWRIVNRQDLVPKLPPTAPLPYEHVNTLYELNPPPNAINPTIPCMHALTTYLWLMSRQTGDTGYRLDANCAAAGAAQA